MDDRSEGQVLYILAFQFVKQTLRSKHLSGLILKYHLDNWINGEVTTKMNHKSRGTRPSPCVRRNLEAPAVWVGTENGKCCKLLKSLVVQLPIIRPKTEDLSFPPKVGPQQGQHSLDTSSVFAPAQAKDLVKSEECEG